MAHKNYFGRRLIYQKKRAVAKAKRVLRRLNRSSWFFYVNRLPSEYRNMQYRRTKFVISRGLCKTRATATAPTFPLQRTPRLRRLVPFLQWGEFHEYEWNPSRHPYPPATD